MELESNAGVKELRSLWEFASIYSFFNEFRDTLELTGFSIEDLEQAIQVNPKDSPLMQDIWIKLLLLISRKKASLIHPDTWEATLRTAINQHQSAYWLTNPLKICEYKRLPLRKRVFVLKSVIDWVLEDSEMLQRYIDRQKTDKMRYSPLGTDANGSVFWYLNDYRLYKETQVSDEDAQKRRDERRARDKQDREVMKRAADEKRRREEEKRQANVRTRPREFYMPIVEEVKTDKKETIEATNTGNNNNQPADNIVNDANTNGVSEVQTENNTNQADKMEVEQSLLEGESAVKDEKQNDNNNNHVNDEEEKPEGELKQNNNADDDVDVGITYEDEQIVEESDEMKEEDLHSWELVCRNTTEWGHFVEQFKESKHAGEREIAAFIDKNIIEHISTKMQAYLHAKRRTHLLPIQHRKKSTRLQMKEIQKSEQRVTRSGGRRKDKDVKVSREDRLEARRHRRDVNLAKALASPDELSEASAPVVDENGNPIEQPPQEQSPTVVKPPRPKPPPRPKGPRKTLAEELLELEKEEGPLSDDDESADDDDFDGGEKPRRRASTGASDAGRGRGPRTSLSPTAGRPRGPRQHKSNFETELVPTVGATFVSSRGRQVKTRMWNDQEAADDFEERISSSPAARKPVKQNHPRVNPDPTFNLKLKLALIKETLGEEGFAKAITPKARVGRPPKSAVTPKKEIQQEDFVPASEEEEFEDEDEEEEYEDQEDEDFDVGTSKRRKSAGSAGKNSRRGSSAHHTASVPSFMPQAFSNTNSLNSAINSQRVGMTSSLDSMQSNISSLLTNITPTPSVGAYKPPLIFGNTVSPTDINWNFVAAPKSAAPVVADYTAQSPLSADNSPLKRTSGQMDANSAAYGVPQEGQPVLKRQRLDEAELLMSLLPTGARQPAANMSSSVTSTTQPVLSMQNMYSVQQQQPLSYQQNPFAQISPPVFSSHSVMNYNNAPLNASTASLNHSGSINLFTSDELPQSAQASQVSATNSQDIDQFLNLGPDSDNK